MNGRSATPMREPAPCGDLSVDAGRTHCQHGWYDRIGKAEAGRSVLDVGAGLCLGLDQMIEAGCDAYGFDVDATLVGRHSRLTIGPVSSIPSGAYDVVTCFDVIEHVVDDVEFFSHLIRIARDRVYVTTPNFVRSQCANRYHCREYTIPGFWNTFQPDELYVGSPDGRLNVRLLLSREPNGITDHGLAIVHGNRVPDEALHRFEGDGQVWAHMMGVFNVQAWRRRSA